MAIGGPELGAYHRQQHVMYRLAFDSWMASVPEIMTAPRTSPACWNEVFTRGAGPAPRACRQRRPWILHVNPCLLADDIILGLRRKPSNDFTLVADPAVLPILVQFAAAPLLACF